MRFCWAPMRWLWNYHALFWLYFCFEKTGWVLPPFWVFFWDATSESLTIGNQRGETNVVKPSPSHRVRKLRKEKKEDDLDDFGFQLFWVTSRQFLCDVADKISSTYAGVEIKVDSQIMMKRLDDICENLLLVSFVQHESMQLFNSCCCYQTLSETDGCLTFVPCDEGLSMYIARPRLRWTGQASPRIEILLRPKKCKIHPSSRVKSIFGVSQHLATPQPSQMVHRYYLRRKRDLRTLTIIFESLGAVDEWIFSPLWLEIPEQWM